MTGSLAMYLNGGKCVQTEPSSMLNCSYDLKFRDSFGFRDFLLNSPKRRQQHPHNVMIEMEMDNDLTTGALMQTLQITFQIGQNTSAVKATEMKTVQCSLEFVRAAPKQQPKVSFTVTMDLTPHIIKEKSAVQTKTVEGKTVVNIAVEIQSASVLFLVDGELVGVEQCHPLKERWLTLDRQPTSARGQYNRRGPLLARCEEISAGSGQASEKTSNCIWRVKAKFELALICQYEPISITEAVETPTAMSENAFRGLAPLTRHGKQIEQSVHFALAARPMIVSLARPSQNDVPSSLLSEKSDVKSNGHATLSTKRRTVREICNILRGPNLGGKRISKKPSTNGRSASLDRYGVARQLWNSLLCDDEETLSLPLCPICQYPWPWRRKDGGLAWPSTAPTPTGTEGSYSQSVDGSGPIGVGGIPLESSVIRKGSAGIDGSALSLTASCPANGRIEQHWCLGSRTLRLVSGASPIRMDFGPPGRLNKLRPSEIKHKL